MLQELCRLAEREQLVGDPAFEVKPIAWIIELTATGELIGTFTGTHQPVPEPASGNTEKRSKAKEQTKKFRIPRQFNPETGGTRTSGDFAYFLVDKSDYVLGCIPGTKAHVLPANEKLLNRHRLFIDKVRACFEATKERKLEAVLKFLERIHTQGLPVNLPEKALPGDLFAFIVRPDIDDFVHDLPAIQTYWRGVCNGTTTPEAEDWHCLITGCAMNKPSLFPQIKRVPGAQAQSGLVSFNALAFESYGWKSNANAPVSNHAAQAASVAMNRLLDPAFQRQDGRVLQRRNIRLSSDTVACYWATESTGEDIAATLQAALQADPGGKAGQLWQAVWRGKRPATLDPSRFYAVTITGAQGRAIVRDWYETTVGEVQASLATYFGQLELSPNTFPAKGKSLPPQFALRVLQECLTASGKADDLPSKHSAALFAAALNRKVQFPSALLSLALERMRAEAGRKAWIEGYRRDARTALIKALLIRNHHIQLIPTMDPNNHQSGYLLGRLFACIERMQYLALGDQVNANIANRYFAAASSTPRSVLNTLCRDLESHYLKKAMRKRRSAAHAVHREICEVQKLFGSVMRPTEGYPTRLSPADQGLFMVGYHTQRGHYLPKKEDTGYTAADAVESAEGER